MTEPKKYTKSSFLKENSKEPYMEIRSGYDLNRLGVGFNQPCKRCGLGKDRRTSGYEPIGFQNFCKCNKS